VEEAPIWRQEKESVLYGSGKVKAEDGRRAKGELICPRTEGKKIAPNNTITPYYAPKQPAYDCSQSKFCPKQTDRVLGYSSHSLGRHDTCMNNPSRSEPGRISIDYAIYQMSCVAVEKKKSRCHRVSPSSVIGVASPQLERTSTP
jgi:hypothetical protein